MLMDIDNTCFNENVPAMEKDNLIYYKQDGKIIHAPIDAKYYSDFMQEIPANCIHDKGITGCGATTLAITNNIPTVIAMPFINLVESKTSQHENLLGVTGDTTEKEIMDYIQQAGIIKIAVTYDSLPKVVEAYKQATGKDAFKDLFLLVDEEHVLANQYVFRNPAIKKLLELSRKFERKTFLTATPIDKEFQLKELEDMPLVKIIWDNAPKIKIIPYKTNKPAKVVQSLIEDALHGKMFGNLHFFLNSVEMIGNIIRNTSLTPEQARIVCADNIANQEKLGNGFKIEKTVSPAKKINFYTSTAFEGCDIYDKEGRTYIVSDNYKSSTLLDISTYIIQIAGRIRDSQYANEIVHIFNETCYSGNVTLEEYKEITLKDLQIARNWVREVNGMTAENRHITIGYFNESKNRNKYIVAADNRLEIDENRYMLDIRNFKISNWTYRSDAALEDEYIQRGFCVQKGKLIWFAEELLKNPKKKIPFKELFEEYAKLKESHSFKFHLDGTLNQQQVLEKKNPLVKEAYEKLGAEKVKDLEYKQKKIKEALVACQKYSLSDKITEMLKGRNYHEGCIKTLASIKKDLVEIYAILGIESAAKATDLTKWFYTKELDCKIKGKTARCYAIIRQRFYN